jgi:hypothetical protein
VSPDDAAEIQRIRRQVLDVNQAGLSAPYYHADPFTPSGRMVRDLIGALAAYLLETGYRREDVAA